MLVLSRNVNEEILIGNDIKIRILGVIGGRVRVGISAPRNLTVLRKEIVERIAEEQIANKDQIT